jgi:mRNA interferase RelE/StbE
MKLFILPRVEKELRKLPKFDQIAVGQKIRALREPQIPSEEKLAGYTHIYRVRVGQYRIVYKKTSDEITIILIGHRKDLYRKLTSWMR